MAIVRLRYCGDCGCCDEQIDVNWCNHTDKNSELTQDIWDDPIPSDCPILIAVPERRVKRNSE